MNLRSGRHPMTRVAILAGLLLALSPVSSAYYYWIYFPGRTGPFKAYPAKFDLSALPDKTVSYFISDKPPGKLVDGDKYDALVSQIRLAADVVPIAEFKAQASSLLRHLGGTGQRSS